MVQSVLVVGGTGLIGSALIPALLAADKQVHLTLRGEEPAWLAEFSQHQVVRWPWPGGAAPLPAGLMEQVQAVVNLAGASVADGRWTWRRKAILRQSRIDTTRRLSEAATAQPSINCMITASGVSLYGANSGHVDEDAAIIGDHFLAQLAIDWEQASVSPRADLRQVSLRIGVVLAEDGGALNKIVPPWLPRLCPLLPIGSGRQGLPWIHRRDVVGMMVTALDDDRWHGPVNAVAPELVDNATFTRAAARASGHPYVGLGPPRPALWLLLGEQSAMVFADQWVIPQRAQTWGYHYHFPDLAVALAASL